MSTFICSIMCNYSKVYMVTSKMLNLFVGVHQKVRRQLLYLLYSDNIFCIFHIHIFNAVSKIQCLCTKTNVDNSVTKLWPNLENHFFDNNIFKKKNHFEKIIFEKSNFEKIMKSNWKMASKNLYLQLDPKKDITSEPVIFLGNPFGEHAIGENKIQFEKCF